MGMCSTLQFYKYVGRFGDMRGKFKFSTVIASVVVVTFAVFIAFVMMIISYATKTAYQVEEDTTYEEVVRLDKIQMETEVKEIVDYIHLAEEKASEDIRLELKRRVREAYNIADQIYKDNLGQLSQREIEGKIAESLRDFRYDEGKGYLFMDRFDGEIMLYPVQPQTEGTNILNLKDDFGNFVIRDEINIAKTIGEGYAEGHWIKPGQTSDAGSLKISYIKRFRDQDWYIGTGLYEDDYIKTVKASVLRDLSQFKKVAKGHMFYVANKEGKILLKGKDILSDEQHLETSKLLKAKEMNSGGFLEDVEALEGSDPISLTYLYQVDSWKWIVGIESELSENISESKAYYLEEVMKGFTYIIVFLTLLTLTLFAVMMRFVSRRLNVCFDYLKEVIKHRKVDELDGAFCFKEFEDFAKQIEHVPNESTKSKSLVQNSNTFSDKPVETLMECEAVCVGLIQNLNDVMASDDVSKMTEVRLNQIGIGMMSVRKFLSKMSQIQENVAPEETELNLEYIPLKAHLEQVMKLIINEYSDRSIECKIICDSDLIVYTDPLIVSQIITHLATNAVKHGFHADTLGVITIEVIYDVDYLRVYFSDNGKGMGQNIQERIFEPFYTTSGMQGDIGMGLSEVYTFVNNVLGGAINCSSREGYGTDFFIDIPGNGPGLWFEEPKSEEKTS